MLGAEAVLSKTSFLGIPAVEKLRVGKEYRECELDARIRSERTRREARLLSRAKDAGVLCPVVYEVGEFSIIMKFIEGAMLHRELQKRGVSGGEISEAARIMVDSEISSLPVMHGDELVGIITETDLFNIMLEMLGARRTGVHFTVLIPNKPGQYAKITKAIFEKGGDITALSTFEGDSSATGLMSAKVDGIEQQALQKLIEPLVIKLLEIGTS